MKVSIRKLLGQQRLSLKLILNKYSVSFIFFLIWMIFFDHHKFSDQLTLARTVNQLNAEKVKYTQKIAEIKEDKKDIETNREKYAREKFYMHKPGEEVWIVPDDHN